MQPYLTAAQANVRSSRNSASRSWSFNRSKVLTSPFMSPYQQDVIDTSLQAFDKQAAQQQQL